MEVLPITPRGYCYGVVNAIKLAKQHGRTSTLPVYGLGQIVHNRHVIEDLAHHNVVSLDGDDRLKLLDTIDQGTVIFTAHGVSPAVKRRAVEKGLHAIDATCPDVIRSHDLVISLAGQGYDIVYIGKKGHPEPEGCIGEAPGKVHLVEDARDVELLNLDNPRLAVVTQTTLSQWDTAELIEHLRAKFPGIEVYNEICHATQERQNAAVEAAKICDVVIVVGDVRSSNSKRLVDSVRDRGGKPAYLVDNADEIDPAWLVGCQRVGVTSGASTMSQVTREVIRRLEAMDAGAPATVAEGHQGSDRSGEPAP